MKKLLEEFVQRVERKNLALFIFNQKTVTDLSSPYLLLKV
jgi:hypothetical protein